KQNRKMAGWDLLRISRLSVMPVPKDVWDEVIRMSEQKTRQVES
ncbi:MAG: EVE domain-containing protein, partial [Candidatus Poribacteria bacterium]|nr:EVE domain-containing protein [Candidatus Poribacteria bacterium]